MITKKLALMCALSTSLFGLSDWEEGSQPSMSIEAEFLYWKPHISSLELYAGKNDIVEAIHDGVTLQFMKEYDKDPHLQWNGGYRLSADYQFCSDGFAAGLIWTHFQDCGKKHCDTDNTTKCRIKFDQIDLILSYQAKNYSGLEIKPLCGVRWSKIHEKIDAALATPILFAPSALTTVSCALEDYQNYHGIGPILGVIVDWNLKCGFALYGSAGVSLLYADSKLKFNDTSFAGAPISKATWSRNKRKIHTFDWNIDLAIGMIWKTQICDRYAVEFNLGFEHHQYFNQCHLGVNRGDLTFDGAVFGVNLSL